MRRNPTISLVGLLVLPPLIAAAPADPEDCERVFEETREKWESQGDAPPEVRFPILQEFAKAPCQKTVRYLQRLYREESNPGVHMTVTRVLGKIGSEEAVEAIVAQGVPVMKDDVFAMSAVADALAEDLDPDAETWFLRRGRLVPALREHDSVWTDILRAMTRFESDDRHRALVEELRKGGPPEIQVALLRAVEEQKSPSVARAAKRLLRSDVPEVQAAALYCLWRQAGDRYARQFERSLRSPHWQVRTIALRVLTKLEPDDLVEQAAGLLDDPDLRVQVVAVRALMRTGGREVIEPLIERLSTAEGRLKDDIADALARLTGRNFGPAAVQWESWWGGAKDRPGEYEAMSLEEYSELLAEASDQQTLLYHGLRVLSDHVAFVIDTSESMKQKYVPIELREKGRTVVEGQPQKDQKTRMEVARQELRQVLSQLDEGKAFDVAGFDSVVKDFIQDGLGKRPVRLETMAGPVRGQALAFVNATRPAGKTHMLEALRTLFQYADLDTVYLLSDGAPTPASGSMEEILEWVRDRNRLRNVRINTIGFDLEDKEKEFLITLSDENYGVFVER